MNQNEAADVLACFLFEDINNNVNHSEDEWDITWVGNKFVLRNRETGDKFHFKVKIKPHKWDSTQAQRDQEWHLDDEWLL